MLGKHHFLSYSSVDGSDFAGWLHDALETSKPPHPIWLDKRDLKAGRSWDTHLDQAIRDCMTLLFVMTEDSVEDKSVCHNEWMQALSYKKQVIPLLLHPNARVPFRLNTRHFIDFSSDYDKGLADLAKHLLWIHTPKGKLAKLQEDVMDATRRQRRAEDEIYEQRIQDEIDELNRQISAIETTLANPDSVHHQTHTRIRLAIRQEMLNSTPPPQPKTTTQVINNLPVRVPQHFQNRHGETRLIGELLNEPDTRLITVIGRGGIGKTALVCRLLEHVQHNGHLPDEGDALAVNGIVYLSAVGRRPISVYNLYHDLTKILPPEQAAGLTAAYQNPQASTTDKFAMLLGHFTEGTVLILLDNFEDLLDAETYSLIDSELLGALTAILTEPPHALKLIITTRFMPQDLAKIETRYQERLTVGQLDERFSMLLLKSYDKHGLYGIREADDDLLQRAYEVTRGFPRALEALAGILKSDSSTSLSHALGEAERNLAEMQISDEQEDVIGVIVGQAFNRLDDTAQQVIQALAIFGQPVSETAVDFLLQLFTPEIDSEPILKRLVNADFVRRETDLYYLHPIDREYALASIPTGEQDFNRRKLYRHASTYFQLKRKPKDEWKTFEDVQAFISEYKLLREAGDFDAAAQTIRVIVPEPVLRWGYIYEVIDYLSALRGKLQNHENILPLLQTLGMAYATAGQPEAKFACHQEGYELAKKHGAKLWESKLLGSLGMSHFMSGRMQDAIMSYEEALAIAEDLGDLPTSVAHHLNLGVTLMSTNRLEEAEMHFEASAAQFEAVGDPVQQIVTFLYLGELSILRGNYDKALEVCEQAYTISREIGFKMGILGSQRNLSKIYFFQNKLDQAWQAIEEAAQFNLPYYANMIQTYRGLIAVARRDYPTAQSALQNAVAGFNDILTNSSQYSHEDWDFTGLAHCGLLLCTGQADHRTQAIQAFQNARAMMSDQGWVNYILLFWGTLASGDQDNLLTDDIRQAIQNNA